MELTKLGRYSVMQTFYDTVLKNRSDPTSSDISNTVLLARQTEWPGGTVPLFNPDGMESDVKTANELQAAATRVHCYVVKPGNTGTTVTYNGGTYTVIGEFADTAADIVLSNNSFLLYVEFTLQNVSSTAFTFRQIGFGLNDGLDYLPLVYQNIPAVSITTAGGASVTLKVIFAF